MTARERVRRAVRHGNPDRIPVTNLIVDWQRWINVRSREDVAEAKKLIDMLPDDSFYVNYALKTNGNFSSVENGVAYDDWGCGWVIKDKIVQKHTHPFKDGYHLIDYESFPLADSPGRFDAAGKMMADKGEKYVLATTFFTVFERLWFMRGMENILVDPYTEYEDFAKLRDRQVEFNLGIVDIWKELGADGIFFSDDWGSQHGLFINPEDWRRLYKPSYKLLFEHVKNAGMDVWMHLDGDINAIIPDLIEIGLDVYNPVQNNVVDMDFLGREYGGHLCFNGGVDVQDTLPHGTPDDIARELEYVVKSLSSNSGGFVMAASHTIMPDTPMENLRALVHEIAKYTGYKA